MKRLLLLFLCASFMGTAAVQDSSEPIKKTSAFVELAGNGVHYSLNYDRTLLAKPKRKLADRIGAMHHSNFTKSFAIQ